MAITNFVKRIQDVMRNDAGVNVALDESLHIGVVEQGGVNLYEPPGGGLMGAPPCQIGRASCRERV